jgi:S1-C subfamily serine protease
MRARGIAAAATALVLAAAAPAAAVNWHAALGPEEPSIVRITSAANLFDTEEWIGSGFFTHGVLVTCYHVIEHAHYHINVWFPGSDENYYARIVYEDPAQDLALLELDTGYDPGDLPLARGEPRRGAQVAVVGHPNGVARLVITPARVLSDSGSVWVEDYGRMRRMLVLDGAMAPGDSGAPVLTPSGHVVGVYEYGTSGTDIGGAVPVARLWSLLNNAGY